MAQRRHTNRTAAAAPRDHYAEVTQQIIAALEQGTLPWRRPWNPDQAQSGYLAPRNGATNRRYRGINVLLLGIAGFAFGGDPRWMTYRQASERGWQVRRGSWGTRIFFYRQLALRDADRGDDDQRDERGVRRVPLLRAYTVFHLSQIDGAPPFEGPPPLETSWRTPDAVQLIVTNSGAVVREGGDKAFYSPSTDHIQMPPIGAFESESAHAATLLHELGHWSGTGSRLARDLSGRFGSFAYAQEELRAELASCFLGGELGLPCDIPNHASYLECWLKVLRDDKREIFRAAADAQRIADYLLEFHPDQAARLAEERAADDDAETEQQPDAELATAA